MVQSPLKTLGPGNEVHGLIYSTARGRGRLLNFNDIAKNSCRSVFSAFARFGAARGGGAPKPAKLRTGVFPG